MKNFLLLFLIAFTAISCNKEHSVIVSGKITNPTDKLARLAINYLDKIDSITLDTDGTFFTEIDLKEEHVGWFGHGQFAVPLYLVPGAKINLEFDAENSEGSIFADAQITGKGSETSAFIYSLYIKPIKYSEQELLKMPVDSFATMMNDTENSQNDELKKFIADYSPSKKFIKRIGLRQKTNLALKYFSFIKNHKYYLPEDKTPIPDSFQKYIDVIPLNDAENFKEISEYRNFLYQYHRDNIDKKMEASGLKPETVAYINKLADEIIGLNTPQEIKDYIGEWKFSVFYKRPDSLMQAYRARYGDVVKNHEYVEKFEEEFEKIVKSREKLKPGNEAPVFCYPDINGEMISSESLKGKVIYVDVWATWCGPCIYEIPHLNRLEKELHGKDIAFVSISIDYDKDKEAWENMVKEKELGGYQLYAKGAWDSKIVEDYVIKGIPYFIIVDKEGKLVEVNTSRPSNPETKEKLLMLAES